MRRILLSIFISSLFFVGPALVQQKTGGATSGDVTITLDASPTVGNSLIAVIGHRSTRTVTGITGGGVTWTQDLHPTGPTIAAIDIWHGHNSDGSSAVVTISFSSVTHLGAANVSEWSGLNNAAPESTNTNSAAADASLTSNSVTPTSAASIVIAGFHSVGGIYSSGPTNSFTRLTQATVSSTVTESAYQIESSSGTYSTGFTYTAAGEWVAAIAAFGAPTSGPTQVQKQSGFFMPDEGR